jgi:hypothetical protein
VLSSSIFWINKNTGLVLCSSLLLSSELKKITLVLVYASLLLSSVIFIILTWSWCVFLFFLLNINKKKMVWWTFFSVIIKILTWSWCVFLFFFLLSSKLKKKTVLGVRFSASLFCNYHNTYLVLVCFSLLLSSVIIKKKTWVCVVCFSSSFFGI